MSKLVFFIKCKEWKRKRLLSRCMSKRFFYNIWRENVLRNGLNLLVILKFNDVWNRGGGGGGKDYKFRWFFVYLFLED